MPTISRQDHDSSTLHLTVTLTREELKPKLDAELKRFRQRATLKGFRPGQAPMSYVKSMYGSSIFYDIFNDMMAAALTEHLRELELDILGQPLPLQEQPQKYSFKIDSPEPEYSVVYEIGHAPYFEFQGIGPDFAFNRYAITNLDELVEKEFQSIYLRAKERTNPDDTLQEADLIYVEAHEVDPFTSEYKEEGWKARIMISVKDITDEALQADFLTKKKGDIVEFDPRLVDGAYDEIRMRKYVLQIPEEDDREISFLFRGEITEVARIVLPELDEVFFEERFGPGVTTQDAAMPILQNNIRMYYQERANLFVISELRKHLEKHNPVNLPVAFLRRWVGVNNSDKSEQAIDADYPSFLESLNWNILSKRLKVKYNIEITEEQIRDDFREKVLGYFRYGLDAETMESFVTRMMENEEEVDRTEDKLGMVAIFDAIMQEVTLVDVPVHSDEFVKLLEAFIKKDELTSASTELEEAGNETMEIPALEASSTDET